MACDFTSYDEMQQVGTWYGGGSRRGVEVSTGYACIGTTADSLTFKLKRTGSPTGTCKFAIWSSGNVEQVNFGTLDVTTIDDSTETDYTLDTPSTTYNIQAGDIMAVEFTGGDSSNFIACAIDNSTSAANEALADYPSNAWRFNDDRICYYKLNYESPIVSSGLLLPPPVAWI